MRFKTTEEWFRYLDNQFKDSANSGLVTKKNKSGKDVASDNGNVSLNFEDDEQSIPDAVASQDITEAVDETTVFEPATDNQIEEDSVEEPDAESDNQEHSATPNKEITAEEHSNPIFEKVEDVIEQSTEVLEKSIDTGVAISDITDTEEPIKPIIKPKPVKLRRPDAVKKNSAEDPYDVEFPDLTYYMPWLSGEPEIIISAEAQQVQVVDVENVDDPENKEQPVLFVVKADPAKIKTPVKRKKASAPRPRWKQEEPQVSDRVAEVWSSMPKHLKFLAAINGYQPAVEPEPKKRKRRTDNRNMLIERLTDPVLTLDETAMLLGVCSTTIRRYTDKGWIPHHRTKGNQRRFRLSDIVVFLEQHGKNESIK